MDQLKKPTFSSQKLSTVYDLDILDTGIEETFDNIFKSPASIFNVKNSI